MTIVERKNKDGTMRYRALVRVERIGFEPFCKSATFSTEKLAKAWRRKLLAQIETDPSILNGAVPQSLTLAAAIDRYLSEIGDRYGKTKTRSLKLIARLPISAHQLEHLSRAHYTDLCSLRENPPPHLVDQLGIRPCAPPTIQQDLNQIRSLLGYAIDVWGIGASMAELDAATRGLRRARRISPSNRRDRLPTSAELTVLTHHFKQQFESSHHAFYPIHLIMWLSIYTPRRLSEVARLHIADYDGETQKIRGMKSPHGSAGNDKTLVIDPPAARVIAELLKPRYRDSMLRSKHGRADTIIPGKAYSISNRFTETCKLLGIEDLHWHDLRHEGVTRLAEQGMTIPQMQQRSGHDSWGSLQRYSNVRPRPKVLELTDLITLDD